MIAEHPLLGCGPGNFKNAYTAYKLPEASEEVADPHNFVLEIWATAGTLTMLVFVAALGGFFWVTGGGWRVTGGEGAMLTSPWACDAPGQEQAATSPATRHPPPATDKRSPLFVLLGGLVGFWRPCRLRC